MAMYKVGEVYRLYLSLSQLTVEQLGTDRINQLKSLPLDLSLKELPGWDELVIQLVGSWEQKSGELEGLRFLINKGLSLSEVKKVGSWEQKSGEFLRKRGKVIIGTLILTLIPITLEELASILGYRSKERYRDDYVKPLRDTGLIEYTIDQANDPNQQYRITQRGVNFLVGSAV